MKILILNWRDIKNPESGGAEILTHEMAKRWVKWGHQVTQLSAAFPGCQKEEIVDGVKIIRRGRWWTVHFLAILYYFRNLRGQVDIIVDEVHWFPFFAAVYARSKTVLLVCEVAKKRFFIYFPYLVAIAWRQLEKVYLFLYQKIPTLTISPSTKRELIDEGFAKEKITILPMGLTMPAGVRAYPKEKDPTIIYLGRVNKLKGVEDAIDALEMVRKQISRVKLWLVGSGVPDYEKQIKRKVSSFGLALSVKFFGHVSDQKKFELLSRAWTLMVPSKHEGWGLVVPEAGVVGTPAVVYHVAGLQDVVKDKKTGLICQKNTPQSLAQNLIALLRDRKQLVKLGKKAKNYYGKMNWDKTAKTALSVFTS